MFGVLVTAPSVGFKLCQRTKYKCSAKNCYKYDLECWRCLLGTLARKCWSSRTFSCRPLTSCFISVNEVLLTRELVGRERSLSSSSIASVIADCSSGSNSIFNVGCLNESWIVNVSRKIEVLYVSVKFLLIEGCFTTIQTTGHYSNYWLLVKLPLARLLAKAASLKKTSSNSSFFKLCQRSKYKCSAKKCVTNMISDGQSLLRAIINFPLRNFIWQICIIHGLIEKYSNIVQHSSGTNN